LNNMIYLINSKSLERLPVEMSKLPGLITSLAFNPNQDLLASKDYQGNVQIWDLKDGKLVALFEEISMSPGGLTFNQDGSILYVGGYDGTIDIISTSATQAAEAPAAVEPGAAAIPELSNQPYIHSSSAITVNLPKGWKVEERDNLSLKADHPNGSGSIIISAVNSADSSDESFIKFIDDTEKRFLTALPGLVETERNVDAQKGTAFVTHEMEGKLVMEVYYTRVDAVDYSAVFITDKNLVEAFLPVYKGVFSSIKINKEYMQKQLTAGITAVPELSEQPFTHTSGSMTVKMPKGWRVEESGNLIVKATDPNGLGNLLISVTNTIKPLSDEYFVNFINATGQNISRSLPGSKEIERKVEPQNNSALVTYSTSAENIELIIQMLYTKVNAVVTLITFMTPKSILDKYNPVYQGVTASFKLNNEYVMKQMPYQSGPTIQDPGGKFEYFAPGSWMKADGNTSNGTNVRYSAPDGSASMNLDVISLNSGANPTDDQIYILMQTAMQKQDPDFQVLKREKTSSGNWQISYAIQSRKLNGIVIATHIGDTLQILNVNYASDLAKQYYPLAVKAATSLKKK
jgi:WD40 repeat protein